MMLTLADHSRAPNRLRKLAPAMLRGMQKAREVMDYLSGLEWMTE